jgi:T5SS/PEP-CTERM-associated repeat protein
VRSRCLQLASCAGILVFPVLCATNRPAGAEVIESYWIPEGGDFDDPANWSGPVPDETVTAIFDLDLELGPFIWFRADEVSDRAVIRDGHVFFLMWDEDEQGDWVSRAYDVMNPNITTPSIVVAGTPGVDAALTIDSGFVTARSMVIGHGAGSSATVEFNEIFDLTPGLACTEHLHVGGGGNGLLLMENGVSVTAGAVIIGIEESSSGQIVLADPASALDIAGDLTVGLQGSGVLSIGNEADLVSGIALIGQQPGSSGEVTIAGLGASWTILGTLDVGFQGQGALTITDGVVLTDGFAVIGSFPEPGIDPTTGGTGTVTISGPTAFWWINGDLHVGLLWEGSLNVFDGAAVASQNGFIGLGQNPVGQATLQGPGSAWSNIGDLAVAATLHVSDGAIVIADTVEVLSEGVLEGDGTVDGAAVAGGTVRPGNPLGTLTVDGDLAATGQLEIEIAGPDPGGFDAVSVMGGATIGGILIVTFIDGYVPQLGDMFEILTADVITGSFGTVTLPDVPPALTWYVSQSTGSITLVITKLGDLDGDGEVGITDFLALIGAWGPCPDPPDPCPGDLDGDGEVGVADLLILLGNWG